MQLSKNCHKIIGWDNVIVKQSCAVLRVRLKGLETQFYVTPIQERRVRFTTVSWNNNVENIVVFSRLKSV